MVGDGQPGGFEGTLAVTVRSNWTRMPRTANAFRLQNWKLVRGAAGVGVCVVHPAGPDVAVAVAVAVGVGVGVQPGHGVAVAEAVGVGVGNGFGVGQGVRPTTALPSVQSSQETRKE